MAYAINQSYDINKCHALLLKKSKQCSRKKPHNCDYCKTHEKIRLNKGLVTIFTVNTHYNRNINKKNGKNKGQIIKIQKYLRGNLVRRNIQIRGTAVYVRNKCVNITDCMELGDINTIPPNKFFSYIDNNIYWGFHVKTFNNLLKYNSINPYNMKQIPSIVIDKFKLLKYNDVIKEKKIHDKFMNLQEKCVNVFQKIDVLNNYTKCSWFLDLNSRKLKTLYYYLFDLWNFRLNFSNDEKKKYIKSQPVFIIDYSVLKKYTNYYKIAHIILSIFDRFLSEGETVSDKSTAANWILSVLTLVSLDARNAFPWLYQAAYPG